MLEITFNQGAVNEHRWRVVKRPDQDVVHILPIGDFEPHDELETCRCEPERKPVEDGACDLLVHQPYNPEFEKEKHMLPVGDYEGFTRYLDEEEN